jgi:hypothetical protein
MAGPVLQVLGHTDRIEARGHLGEDRRGALPAPKVGSTQCL